MAFAALALVAFVVAERRGPEPMVDFSFFRSRSFLGANLVSFIVTFAMLAMFFFLALYMQNVRGYSPLEAGVRFLPSTVMIIIIGPLAGRLTDRIGPRPLMTAGLLTVAVSMFWQGHLAVDTSYGFLLPAFMLMGIGMGLVMSPMSTAAMNAVEHTKAGVASGILSMSRMVGGTFGVAVMGALVTALGSDRLADLLPRLSEQQRSDLAESLGAGGAQVSGDVAAAVANAFVHALNSGLRLAAVLCVVGAALTWWLIAPEPASAQVAEAGAEGAVAAPAGEPA
jgi:MFS family permease